MCGGALEITTGASVIECDYCGTQQSLPRLDDNKRVNMYDRANHFRRNNEFDKAMGIYEQILNEDTTDAEAYWSIVLCRYGIDYVEDPSSHKRIPTVNRTQYTSIFDDDNYKSALQYADGYLYFQQGYYNENYDPMEEHVSSDVQSSRFMRIPTDGGKAEAGVWGEAKEKKEEQMAYEVLKDLAIIIVFAKFFGLVARKCKAPQVVGEIIAGLLIGPCLLGIVQQTDFLTQMAEIGVILLMFSAGLETDLKELLNHQVL